MSTARCALKACPRMLFLAVPGDGDVTVAVNLIRQLWVCRTERCVMKRAFFLGLLLCGLAVGAKAQAVDADVCAIVKNPTSFDGKTVRIKGIAYAGYDQFIIKSADVCG